MPLSIPQHRPPVSKPQTPTQRYSLEQAAYALLSKPQWNIQDLDKFTQQWAAQSTEYKAEARTKVWFESLETEIILRINQLKIQSKTSDNPAAYQHSLNALRVFYGALNSD